MIVRASTLDSGRVYVPTDVPNCDHEVRFYRGFAQYTGCKSCDEWVARQRQERREELGYG